MKAKIWIKILVISLLSYIFMKNSFAQQENTMGAQAYLSINTWDLKEQYDSSHMLMVPLYYAYKKGDDNLKKMFKDNVNKFIDVGQSNINLNKKNQRLTNLQYLYFLSEYNLFDKRNDLSQYLMSTVENVWLEIPAWQWERKPFINMKERLIWKLNSDKSLGYKRMITDEDLFLFGIAANLNHIYPENKILKDISFYTLKTFEKRSSFDESGRWLFDVGVYNDYNDFVYAGYTSKINVNKKKILQNMVSDSSHFFRMPKILFSLQNSYSVGSENYKKYQLYRDGLSKQFFDKVLVKRNDKIYLTNYMNGENGIYRWEYSTLGKGKGYGPYELTYSFGMGWWTFLPDDKIKTIYEKYYNQIKNNYSSESCKIIMNDIKKDKKIVDRRQFIGCNYIYNSYLAQKY